MDGSNSLGTVTLSSTGQATLSTKTLAVGSHSLTAVYGGDISFNGSTSLTITQTVSKDNTTATLTSSANPSVLNQSVSFTSRRRHRAGHGDADWHRAVQHRRDQVRPPRHAE